MSYVFPYILLRVKPYFSTNRLIIHRYTYGVAVVMAYVDQYGEIQVVHICVMAWYINMGNYIIKCIIPSKPSLHRMFDLTKK